MRVTSRRWGQSQILDSGTGFSSIPANSFGTLVVTGTIWPLIVDTSFFVYNLSGYFSANPGEEGRLLAWAASVYAQFLDASNNVIPGAFIVLSEGNWTSPGVLMGSENGINVAADGDPLIEIAAGFQVTGSTSRPSAVQLAAAIDVKNSDPANPAGLNPQLNALISIVPKP
jgi:hypothetical protein